MFCESASNKTNKLLNYSDMRFEVLPQREPASTESGSETTLNEVLGDVCHLALCSRAAVSNRVRETKAEAREAVQHQDHFEYK